MPTLTSKHTRHDAVRWTDDELRKAVASSMSWAAVARTLGYHPTATQSRKIMQARADELEIDTAHFRTQPGRPRKARPLVPETPPHVSASVSETTAPTLPRPSATIARLGRRSRLDVPDAQFAGFVSAAASWTDVLSLLGYSRTTEKAIATIQERARSLRLPTDHFPPSRSDDELAAAVAGARSWRDVARALDLQGRGGRQLALLKSRSEALGLDVSHFAGTRRWSEAQLRHAIEPAITWQDVAEALNVTVSRQLQIAIRRHAAKLGIPTDHLPDADTPPSQEGRLRHLREAGTTIAAAWFTLRGYAPSIPVEAQPYDLLVDMGDVIQRVQVKTCMSKREVTIARRLPGTSKGALVPYASNEVDVFFLLDGDLSIFLIPISEVQGKLRISLTKHRRFRVGSASSLIE
ncbi:group I intron-associated PD-(D/E)XK endonuclease [Nonomuraea wenchangensis]